MELEAAGQSADVDQDLEVTLHRNRVAEAFREGLLDKPANGFRIARVQHRDERLYPRAGGTGGHGRLISVVEGGGLLGDRLAHDEREQDDPEYRVLDHLRRLPMCVGPTLR